MIDIERLKVDESLWPEGAKFWCRLERRFFNNFVHGKSLIPRPTNPEWVDGLPPVGERCEVQMGSYWYAGEVIGKTKEAIWFKSDERSDYWTIMNAISVRPLKTAEQRQREELKELVSFAVLDCKQVESHKLMDAIIDAILSKYNLTEK